MITGRKWVHLGQISDVTKKQSPACDQTIKRYFSSTNHLWKKTFEQFLYDAGLNPIILKSNFYVTKVHSHLLSDYLQVLKQWSIIGDTTYGKEQCLWYNTNILIGNQPVYYAHFSNVGINVLSDLFEQVEGSMRPKQFQYWETKGLQKSEFLKWYGLIAAVKRNGLRPRLVNGDWQCTI
jgi:hypothetical protein